MEHDPLVPIVAEMKKQGLRVNLKLMREKQVAIMKRMAEVLKEVEEATFQGFRPNSSKDVSALLTERGIKLRHTRSGRVSVDKEFLKKLVPDDETGVIALIIEFRELLKRKGYFEVVDKFLDEEGKIHPTFLLEGCKTNRIYCENPNVQQLPVPVRECIEPDEGGMFMLIDYKQQELVILAFQSGDEKLNAALDRGDDLHELVVKELMGEFTEVTKELRDKLGKVINYGIIYGMEDAGVARRIGVNPHEGGQFLKIYLEKFPGVAKWMADSKTEAVVNGYTETIYGERFYLDRSLKGEDWEKEIRRAVNFKIQGSAAGLLRKVLPLLVHDLGSAASLRVLSHDAVLLECSEHSVSDVRKVAEYAMVEAASPMKMRVKTTVGANWALAMGEGVVAVEVEED